MQKKMERKKDIELLFRQHYRPLCLFALHLINNVASAEDIVMDCYLKLWAKWKEEEIKNPKSYLYIAVRNACYDHNQAINNNTNVSIENEAKAIEHLQSEDLSLAEEQACIEAKVWTALDSLPPKCREIFLMSKRDGMSYIEIAEELQLSVKTVEAQITKAYKRLREYAQKFYHFLLSFF